MADSKLLLGISTHFKTRKNFKEVHLSHQFFLNWMAYVKLNSEQFIPSDFLI